MKEPCAPLSMNAGDSLDCSEANRLRQARVNGAEVRPKPVVGPAQEAGHFCQDPSGLVLPALHSSRVVKTIGDIDGVVGSHIQTIQIVVKTDLRSAAKGLGYRRILNTNRFPDQVESLPFRWRTQYFQRRAQKSLQAFRCVGPPPEQRLYVGIDFLHQVGKKFAQCRPCLSAGE